MLSGVNQGRPPSAKPRSRINPITGEEMPYSARGTPRQSLKQEVTNPYNQPEAAARSQSRPDSVPKLSLGKLADQGEDDFTLNMDPACKHDTARTSTTISWGTPSSVAINRRLQDLQHYSDLSDLRISKKKKETVHSHREPTPRQPPSERNNDSDKLSLEKDWIQQPYSKAAEIRLQDKESLEEINRKKKLIETMMIDQLSRPVISRPRNEALSSRHHVASRGSARTRRDISVVIGTATENLLLKRVQFGARVITRNGRDAIRELTGFYFAVDDSITVYEFRKFGKSAKALPFIQRGTYHHLVGPRQGKSYTLVDIKQGECLLFEPRNQPLPDALKSRDTVILKVTEVDDNAKAEILFENVPASEQDEVWKKAHIPQTEEEINKKLLLIKVQECVRSQITKRGIKVFTGLCALYHKLDEEGNGRLNKVELDKSLLDFHIEVPQELFDDLWDALDTDCSGFMEYDLFMHAYLGEMSEKRKALVLKAFRKLDSSKKGEVSFDDMRKFYNAHKHPRVRSGECTEADILEYFFSHFSNTATKGIITFFEFENYYEGLSVCVENDEDFIRILQNEWGV